MDAPRRIGNISSNKSAALCRCRWARKTCLSSHMRCHSGVRLHRVEVPLHSLSCFPAGEHIAQPGSSIGVNAADRSFSPIGRAAQVTRLGGEDDFQLCTVAACTGTRPTGCSGSPDGSRQRAEHRRADPDRGSSPSPSCAHPALGFAYHRSRSRRRSNRSAPAAMKDSVSRFARQRYVDADRRHLEAARSAFSACCRASRRKHPQKHGDRSHRKNETRTNAMSWRTFD